MKMMSFGKITRLCFRNFLFAVSLLCLKMYRKALEVFRFSPCAAQNQLCLGLSILWGSALLRSALVFAKKQWHRLTKLKLSLRQQLQEVQGKIKRRNVEGLLERRRRPLPWASPSPKPKSGWFHRVFVHFYCINPFERCWRSFYFYAFNFYHLS